MKIKIINWRVKTTPRKAPLNWFQRFLVKVFRINPIEAYRVQVVFTTNVELFKNAIIHTEHNAYMVISSDGYSHKAEITKHTNFIDLGVTSVKVKLNVIL